MDSYGYIYKITNLINKKVYIGQTRYSIAKRWSNHLNSYKHLDLYSYPLYFAMNKYGVENFRIEEIEKCKESELNDKEIYWIDFFDSYNNGYNATKGGDGYKRFNIEDSIIIEAYERLGSLEKVMHVLHCRYEIVKSILESHGIKVYSAKELAVKNGYTVLQYKDNKLIRRFSCMNDALRWIQANYLPDTKLDTIRMRFNKKVYNDGEYLGFYWIIDKSDSNIERHKTQIYSLNFKKKVREKR